MALEGPRLERQPGRIVIHPLEAKKVIPPFLDRLFQQNRFLKNNYLVKYRLWWGGKGLGFYKIPVLR